MEMTLRLQVVDEPGSPSQQRIILEPWKAPSDLIPGKVHLLASSKS